MNKQPFYHRLEVLFTATDDLCEVIDTQEFRDALGKFFRRSLGKDVIPTSVEFDDIPSAEPGDPADLMGVKR